MALVESKEYRLADDSSRMALSLRIKDQRLKFDSNVSFIVDTGASSVLLPSAALYLNEEQRKFIQSSAEPVDHCGILTNRIVKYYKYFVSEFRLGKIVFRDFPVHITFENNASMKLLGMPFLKMFDITIQPRKRLMTFSALPVTEKIITEGIGVRGIENVTTADMGAVDAGEILSQLQIENAAAIRER